LNAAADNVKKISHRTLVGALARGPSYREAKGGALTFPLTVCGVGPFPHRNLERAVAYLLAAFTAGTRQINRLHFSVHRVRHPHPQEITVKTLSAFVLLAIFTIVPLAQIPPPPGMPPAAQAQQAFAIVQAQSMIITSQAQLQGMIASQAMMLNSSMARSIFLTQAASLQAQVAGRQGSMFSAQAAAITAMQHSFALQKQLQVQSAILSMRSRGIENASAMQKAVQLSSLDHASFQRTAMLHVRLLRHQAGIRPDKPHPSKIQRNRRLPRRPRNPLNRRR
jgi:hypothetical protein